MKKDLMLKEDLATTTTNPTVAADTTGTNDSAQKIVNNTKAKNPTAGSVIIPSTEIDGNSGTQMNTMEVNNDPTSLQNAQKMAQQFGRMGQDVQFKVNLKNESQGVKKPIVEGIQFTKKEITEWFRKF